ncbi:MAG: phosphatase PAP2 family protein [Actinobacteria bacterium]|nr:phosphatase PAP2 family protein [Actinomycetota bacterium]
MSAVIGSEHDSAPGSGAFGPTVDRFDQVVDELLERVRNHPVASRAFEAASHLGDFSLVWHLVGIARGLTGGKRASQAIAFSALLGAESLLVNQGVKRIFKRERPTSSGDDRFDVRTPATSSFPSGHASSAVFAATVLTTWDGKRTAPLWFGLAAVVGSSRAVVRIHHASDVVAGAAVGLGLGLLARPIIRRLR